MSMDTTHNWNSLEIAPWTKQFEARALHDFILALRRAFSKVATLLSLRWLRGWALRYQVAVVFIMALSGASFTAELWSNSAPLILHYHGHFYFPSYIQYHPRAFGITDSLSMNYKDLKLQAGDWSLWPPLHWGPYLTDKSVSHFPSPPSSRHWLGTDDTGRDIFSRLLYGFRYSLIYAVLVWFLSSVMAVVVGATTGYFGSWLDLCGQRVIEVLSTVPQLFLLLFLISVFEPSMLLLGIVGSLFGWIGLSYFVRGEALRCRKLEFIEAARALGASHFQIIFRHILPNSLVPLLTFAPFTIIANIAALATLDYLGFGLPAPTPSWGELLSQSQRYFGMAWWLAVFPSLALMFTLVSFALVGDGLRRLMDPRQATGGQG